MIRPAASALTLCVTAAVTCGLMTACGSPGLPQPPSLHIPTPVTDLTAARVGDRVQLHWTMPRSATDGVALAGDQRVVVCRTDAAPPRPAAASPGDRCTPVARLALAPGAPALYTDTLPAPLASGSPRLLAYTVVLANRAGRDAGASDAAYAAAGPAPAPIAQLSAEAAARGIILRWAAPPADAAPATLVRLQRTLVVDPNADRNAVDANAARTAAAGGTARAGVPQPAVQTLELPRPPGRPEDHAVDADALLDRRYRYTVERVTQLELAGRRLEVAGEPGEVSIDARDLFPPAVPAGLEAVADTEAGAIDLSWTPDAEPDLAGYFVYRRAAAALAQQPGLQPQRISGPAPLAVPSFRDTAVERGRRYEYTVSAVDRDGNESAQSAPASESVPAAESSAPASSAPPGP